MVTFEVVIVDHRNNVFARYADFDINERATLEKMLSGWGNFGYIWAHYEDKIDPVLDFAKFPPNGVESGVKEGYEKRKLLEQG